MEIVDKMFNMDFAAGMKFALTALAIFAVIGGITAQTTQGASGRGFMEGMWKGVEIFFLAALGVGILYAILWGMGIINTQLNTAM